MDRNMYSRSAPNTRRASSVRDAAPTRGSRAVPDRRAPRPRWATAASRSASPTSRARSRDAPPRSTATRRNHGHVPSGANRSLSHLLRSGHSGRPSRRAADAEVVRQRQPESRFDGTFGTQNPVGTGPYQLEAFEPNNRLVMTRFEDYWRDLGTIPAYWQAHMDLLSDEPPFDPGREDWTTISSAVRPEGNDSSTVSIQSGRGSGARFW
mgnify:CR=1 FL=1